MTDLAVAGEPVLSPAKQWAWAAVHPDPLNKWGTTPWLTSAPEVIGRNLARHGASVLVARLGDLTWPEYQGESPFELTYAVARTLVDGGKVRAVPFVAGLSVAHRVDFMSRLHDAMGAATIGLEHQL